MLFLSNFCTKYRAEINALADACFERLVHFPDDDSAAILAQAMLELIAPEKSDRMESIMHRGQGALEVLDRLKQRRGSKGGFRYSATRKVLWKAIIRAWLEINDEVVVGELAESLANEAFDVKYGGEQEDGQAFRKLFILLLEEDAKKSTNVPVSRMMALVEKTKDPKHSPAFEVVSIAAVKQAPSWFADRLRKPE